MFSHWNANSRLLDRKEHLPLRKQRYPRGGMVPERSAFFQAAASQFRGQVFVFTHTFLLSW